MNVDPQLMVCNPYIQRMNLHVISDPVNEIFLQKFYKIYLAHTFRMHQRNGDPHISLGISNSN